MKLKVVIEKARDGRCKSDEKWQNSKTEWDRYGIIHEFVMAGSCLFNIIVVKLQ